MRRFELVLPDSVEACVKALAQGGGETKVLAGGTDLLPQMKNGVLKPAARDRPVRRSPRCSASRPANGQGLRDRRRGDGARRSSSIRTVRARYPVAGRERRARRLGAGAQPGDRRRQPLQRGAVGRHGAAAHGARRRGRDRRAQGRAARADRGVLHRRAADGAGAGRAAGRARRAGSRAAAAAATTCATRRGASSTSPSWVSPRS